MVSGRDPHTSDTVVEEEDWSMKNVLKFALILGALTACTNPVAPNQKLMGDPPIRTEPPAVPSHF
jgi:hypothetical protein